MSDKDQEIKYLKKCCIKAGKELEKYSFEWDGKEKNLVVQALELNCKYEKLIILLEEITEYLEMQLEKGFEPQSITYQMKIKGQVELAKRVLDLISEEKERLGINK